VRPTGPGTFPPNLRRCALPRRAPAVGCAGGIRLLPRPDSTAHASPTGRQLVTLPSMAFKHVLASRMRPSLQSPTADCATPLDSHRGVMPRPLDQGAFRQRPPPAHTHPKPTPPCSPNPRRLRLQCSCAQLATMAVSDHAQPPQLAMPFHPQPRAYLRLCQMSIAPPW
jgi:hypothetical protein